MEGNTIGQKEASDEILINVSSEEKQQLLNKILPNITKPGIKKEAREELHVLLSKDTNGACRLYRYRKFDENGYGVAELSTGEIFCSKPSNFNDPFDSKLGVTLASLCEAKYKSELDQIKIACQKLIDIMCDIDEKKISIEKEKWLVKKLMDNEDVTSLVREHFESLPTNMCDGDSQIERGYLEDLVFDIALADEEIAAALNRWKNALPTMFDVVAKNNRFGADEDEIDLIARATLDEYPECKESVEDLLKQVDHLTKMLSEEVDNCFNFCCFSTSPTNRLMWPHYSNNYSGFCIEYDFRDIDNELSKTPIPLPIVYSSSRPLVAWEPPAPNGMLNGNDVIKLMSDLLTKDKMWEYENEWRIFIDPAKSSKLKMPKPTCVYLGPQITDGNKASIIAIANARGIRVKQMKVDRGKYELHAEDIGR